MEDRTYNGWTNYETWLAALWFGNDGTGEYFEDEAREIIKRLCDSDDDDLPLTEERSEEAASELAAIMETYIDEQLDPLPPAGLFCDLLNAALREINYNEIAQHYIADAAD